MPTHHKAPTAWAGREDPEDGPLARRIHHLAVPFTGHLVGKDAFYLAGIDANDLALIGFACEAGVARNKGRVGAKEGPPILRKALSGMSAPWEWDIEGNSHFTDLGDIVVEDNALELGQEMLADILEPAIHHYKRILVIGGGHETAFASFDGLCRAYFGKIGIINFDAHLDLRRPGEAGPSSGTPFYQIKQREGDYFDYLVLGCAEEANSRALFERAKKWGVEIITDHALIADPAAADKAIVDMARRVSLIYLTIDLDALPFYQAPGVSAPAARGVPLSTLERLIDKITDAARQYECRFPLIDIVEFSPPYDNDGMTARTAALLARRWLWGNGRLSS